MMDIASVKRELERFSSLSSEELNKYGAVIAAAAASIDYGGEDESVIQQLVLIAAARANYQIALLKSADGGVKSFKAGDVSISESNENAVSSAKALLESLENSCRALGAVMAFDFRAV